MLSVGSLDLGAVCDGYWTRDREFFVERMGRVMKPELSVIGRYQIRSRLGQGSMGAVYLARDPRIGRLVAVKVLRVNSDEMRARFLREAQTGGRLHHQNIVTIYDCGEDAGQLFIAMEFVDRGDAVQSRCPPCSAFAASPADARRRALRRSGLRA